LQGRTLSASLTVKDLEKSLAWYRDVMGFSVDQKHEREGKLMAVSLKAGDVRLLIGQDNGAKGWDRIKGEGFSLQITTDQNIDTWPDESRPLAWSWRRNRPICPGERAYSACSIRTASSS